MDKPFRGPSAARLDGCEKSRPQMLPSSRHSTADPILAVSTP
jgi:hypothetical protein